MGHHMIVCICQVSDVVVRLRRRAATTVDAVPPVSGPGPTADRRHPYGFVHDSTMT